MLIIWAVLTILLIFLELIVFIYASNAKAFIAMLNIINIVCFFCFFLFRRNVERIIEELENLSITVNIKYNHEKRLGFVMIFLLIVFCGYVIFLACYDIDSYWQLIKEDGIVEYSSAFFWFFSAIVVCSHTIKLYRTETSRYQFLFNILLVIFFIACGGEEISWGQRIFGIGTPELIKSINVQGEITLHNIGSISVFSNFFFVITLTFFLLVPFIIKKYSQIKQALYLIYFPIPNRFVIFVYVGTLFVWIFVGLRFGTLGFHPFSFYPEQYYNQMDDEIFEFLAAYSFLCFSILNSVKEVTRLKK